MEQGDQPAWPGQSARSGPSSLPAGQLFERLPRNCRATLRDRVATFKVPVRIWFWEEELPRNPAGKIMKRELRDQALATRLTPSAQPAPNPLKSLGA